MNNQMHENPGQRAYHALTLAMACDGSGLPLYRQLLADHPGGAVPVFMHLSMLRQRGFHDLAQQVERLALDEGLDIAGTAVLPGRDPRLAVAEYRDLFARGRINTAMICGYAKALSHAGEGAELAALFDAGLLSVSHVDERAPDGRPLCEAVRDVLLGLRGQAVFTEKRQSVHLMDRLVLEPESGNTVLDAMFGILSLRIGAYLAALRASAHPVAPHLPADFVMKPWVLYSDGRGYNTKHIHPRGWITGIYYLACDPPAGADGGGALHIEPPEGANVDCPGWLRASVHPEPGMFVIIPSYFPHRVQALGRPGLRIVLPFDLRDAVA